MPSRSNPNVPNKQRKVANRRKVQKKNSINKISKNPRGTATSSVMMPNSGVGAPVSGKKARKLESARNHARQRAIEKAMEQEGEVVMKDAPSAPKSKNSTSGEDKMETDEIL